MLHIGVVFIVFGLFLLGAGIIPDDTPSWDMFGMYSIYICIYISIIMVRFRFNFFTIILILSIYSAFLQNIVESTQVGHLNFSKKGGLCFQTQTATEHIAYILYINIYLLYIHIHIYSEQMSLICGIFIRSQEVISYQYDRLKMYTFKLNCYSGIGCHVNRFSV